VDLNHTNMTEAMFINCRFTDTRQGGAVLDNANFAGAVLCNTQMVGANLFRASFDGAVLIGVDLRQANLVDVNFDGAVLIGVKLDGAEMSAETAAAARSAGKSLAEVVTQLGRHDPAHLAVIAATAVAAIATAASQQTPGQQGAAASSGPSINELLALDFAGLIRELQGRGGPTELGRLRVEGQQVFARGVDGTETRLTTADRAPQQRPPTMRNPEPEPTRAPPPPAAAPAPTSSDFGGAFGNGGLEID
jgi:uncharacterized protein YjbI with pentapeptide repeats